MKTSRVILISGLLVAIAAAVSWLFITHWQRSDQAFKILPKLAVAEQSYLRAHANSSQPLPASVTLQDLVSGGYISTSEVRSLAGSDVTFYPMVTGAAPRVILVRVRMPDGVQIAAMADGSVQQLPR
jgi:hypothetical protein